METKTNFLVSGRRQFLTKVFPAGALLCLGCKGLLALPNIGSEKTSSGQQPKYLDDSGMTVEDVYKFVYGYCIPTDKALAKEIGKEKFLGMLTKANGEVFSQRVKDMAKDVPDRSMKSFSSMFLALLSSPPYNKAFQYEVGENTDKVLEIRFSQCLPAKVCLEMNAGEFGYALECAPTDTMVKSFNPKMRAENPKSLMKGDSVCIERFVLDDSTRQRPLPLLKRCR